ncbi:beta-lactamase family protein [Muricauda sp. CAU 1633]|uniref:serine hydrolase domain-containing protein n=1 Tax=Allomuricauda sp. CAU 1633 TaxID=2816036 RepID=UPI001A8D0DB7|nr:serine hydrolase domain-containing protein [Muricauda sp. CAU 1633]MBO0323247.1 beta-lactamase family protein [Muricauda sp. CAU 1633]
MKTHFLLLACILLMGRLGFAQEFDKAKLDQYFDILETNDKFMGSVAISKDGELIYTRSLGYCDLSTETAINASSIFRIGSISKTFSTVLTFKAVSEGKIDLDQTIDQYFPKLTNSESITIKQLLGHRSGIHNFTNDEAYMTYNTSPQTQEAMIDIIVKAGNDFDPGSKAEYSNSNFVLLTYILEKSFGKSYTQLIEQYIAEPLGLSNTYVGSKIDIVKNECSSYKYNNDWKKETDTDMSIPVGAGAVVSTPTDIVKFSDALFGGKLITSEQLELMETIQDGYGLGLFQFPFHERISYGHTGGIDGFGSLFGYLPDGEVSFSMTSNGSNMNTNDIAIAMLSTVYDKPFEMPVFSSYTVEPETLEQYVGVYSSTSFPLKIDITKKDGRLIGQATGQPSFPLEATAEHQFEFSPAGIVMTFKPEEDTMAFEQRGANFTFTRE